MPAGGQLTIETGNLYVDERRAREHFGLEPGPYVLLRIGDTGVGMAEDVQARLFEPFFTTKPPGKGTGLGLAMVFGIVQQSGGHITTTSAPGAGTTFDIYLPLTRPGGTPEREGTRSRSSLRGDETILLVEDNPEVRRAARRFLNGYGYQVIEAADGDAALRLCRGEGPLDLIITDVVMPGTGGRELVARLAALRPATPVLYISGYADSSALGGAIVPPAVGLLHKPFTAEALVGRVRDILDGLIRR
jgi:CheY-like chemotaxis protein